MSEETNLPKIITGKNKPGTVLTRFKIRDHEVACDEEPLYDGNDEAPDPYDYVITGVGACTAVGLRLYAEKKGWDIGDIDITLTYDQVDGEDVIDKEISFSGDITEKQRKILLNVAHCPTQKMLEKGIKFKNTIINGDR